MANKSVIINGIRGKINSLIVKVEEAQALAAEITQEYAKLGSGAFIVGYDGWTADDVTEAQFTNAVSSCSILFPDILGAHGTNFYALKE